MEQPENNIISFEQLQDFLNDPGLDLPAPRRDISKPENVRWLARNLLIRNKEKVSSEYRSVLKQLARNHE